MSTEHLRVGWRDLAPPLLASLGAAIVVVAAASHWLGSRSLATERILLAEAVAVAVLGAVSIVLARSSGTFWAARMPWIVSGALLGAAAIGRPTVSLWLLPSVLAFAVAGALSVTGERRELIKGAAFAGLATVVNAAVLCATLVTGHGRASSEEFLSLDLRAHALLEDVPLQDVWVFQLGGGGDGRTVQDVRAALDEELAPEGTAIVQGLYKLRRLLGDLFGWDAGACDRTDASYIHRLTDTDRARSLVEPGTCRGSFRTVYDFGDEAVTEATNNLVHSFSTVALVPTSDGYRLYMAIYAKEIGWVTPVYMTLINPLRRMFIYPDLVSRTEQGWAARWGGQAPAGFSTQDPILERADSLKRVYAEERGLGQPTVHRIAEGVYAVVDLYHSAGPLAGVNAGIVLGRDAVVFIDSGMTETAGRFLWELVPESLKEDKRLFLVLTHHHSDHVFGMGILRDNGATVIAHRIVSEELRNDGGFYKSFIAQLEGWSMEEADEVLGDVRLSAPDIAIDNDYVLDLGGNEIRLLVCPGHVPDQIVVYHPRSQTLFGGDTIYESRSPNTRFGGPQEWSRWITELQRLKGLDISTVVPGHGKLSGKDILDQNIESLRTVLSEPVENTG
jgi:glyoxylase-like metal-dependent hydrolase (beta-lactamase superfamily II)